MITFWTALCRARTNPAPSAKSRSFRPRLESLEGREVPAALPVTGSLGAAVIRVAPTSTAQAPMVIKQIYRNETGFVVLKVGPSNRPSNVVPLTLHARENAFQVGEVMTLTKGPSSGAAYFMVTSKAEKTATPHSGSLQVRQITAWYNGKPTLSPYYRSLTAPRWWFDTVKVGDVVREVHRIYGDSWRWGQMHPDPEVEKLAVHNGEGLPNLFKGSVSTVAPGSLDYNCISYGATFGMPNANPAATGWITEKGFRLPPGAKPGFQYGSYNQLVGHLGGYGWKADPLAGFLSPPLRTKSSYLVLFTNAQGGVTHAAIWTRHGVYAKMGADGVFRFDSLAQMEGRLYGKATQWFSR